MYVRRIFPVVFLLFCQFSGTAQESGLPVVLDGKKELLQPEGGWPRKASTDSVVNSSVSDTFGERADEKVKFQDQDDSAEVLSTAKITAMEEEKNELRIPKPDIPVMLNPVDELKSAVAIREEKRGTYRKKSRSLYTLGPGDLVTFATYDRADLKRSVRIAPDGTVSYLQAVAINARGLTVDELRKRMEEELRKYKRDTKIIVTPQELQSKEFAVIGRVKKPGSFTLDRPTTILEGIALAEGVEIGTIRGSAYGLADFGRSFVSRKGRKLDVNLSKLYYQGDLDQNVHLEPNDYLYIASALKNECYVIGSVNRPGRVKMPSQMTLAGIISLSGGFSKEAYRMKVLVIRGDIDAPEVHVVNMRDVLKGEARDEVIRNRDIVFVNKRPFEMVERVLDTAITTYMQTVTAELMNQNYTPFSL